MRARARAAVNEALGLASRGEARGLIPARLAARGWSSGGAWTPAAVTDRQAPSFVVEAARARDAGLMTAGEAWAAREADELAARIDKRCLLTGWQAWALRRDERREFEAAREADERAAVGVELARIRQTKREQAAAVEAARADVVAAGRELVPAGSLGAARSDLERREVEAAARIVAAVKLPRELTAAQKADELRAAAAGLLSAMDWAALVLDRFRAAQSKARARAIFRAGLASRYGARAARIGWAAGMRWLRRNSRREALTLGEVGAAAGVNDLGAGADWALELQSIAAGVHGRAAVYAAAVYCAPLAPCRALVARGISAGLTHNLQTALVGRGRRACGRLALAGRARVAGKKIVARWSDERGRQVEADELAISGRGALWIWAARQSGREMHAARYGLGGRDGREVAADWTASGSVSGAVSDWWDRVDDGAAFETRRAAATRRPSVLRAARVSLAATVWDARRAVVIARAAALAAAESDAAARIAAGSALGSARRGLSAAADRARIVGRALRGESVADVSAWVEVDAAGNRLTAAGRKACERLRAAFDASTSRRVLVERLRAAHV